LDKKQLTESDIRARFSRPPLSRPPHFVGQITGDNAEGKSQLDNLIDLEKPYPVSGTSIYWSDISRWTNALHLV
jgi:hypothetical protein